jgi:hypothetical protein
VAENELKNDFREFATFTMGQNFGFSAKNILV